MHQDGVSLAQIGYYILWPVRGEEFWFGDMAERLTAYTYTL